MKKIEQLYKEWRETTEVLMVDYPKTSIDCGDAGVLEDFNNFAETNIDFNTMLELEHNYNKIYGGVK